MSTSRERAFKGKCINEFPTSFVCIDIETTGLNPAYEDIIEVAAIRVENRNITDTFSETINIHRPLPPFITALTGITDKEIRASNSYENVLTRFCSFVGGDILLGHNVNFDVNFLYDKCLDKTGILFENDFVDTLKIARKLLPQIKHHRLDDLAEYYDIPPRTLHKALGDCEMTVNCYFAMLAGIVNTQDFYCKKTRKSIKI